MSQPFIIIGGGIAGLTAALALLKKGFDVQVYERADRLREAGAGLGISANAMMAMKEIGLEEALLSKGKVVSGIEILSSSGNVLTKVSPGKMNTSFSTENITIHRADLLECLAEALPHSVLHTGKQAVSVKQTASGVKVIFSDGSYAEGQALIAADGIGSAVRKQLNPDVQPQYAGYTAWRGILKNTNDIMLKDRIIEVWGSKGRAGLVPLYDGRIYWFVCINAKENDPCMKKFSAKELSGQFETYKSPVADIIRQTADEDILWTDIYDLPALPHYAFGRIVLIGDAAHAATPNLGQGAGQAMEDALILSHFLAGESSVINALRSFEKARLKRTHRVIKVSGWIGKAAQLSSPVLCKLRNSVMRVMPESLSEKQFKFLFDVNLKP